MTQEALYLIRVLNGFLHRSDPGTFSGDSEKLFQLAEQQSVSGILGEMMLRFPQEALQSRQQELRSLCMQTISIFARRYEKLMKLMRAFDEAGIDHVLFKGAVLRDYYSVPELRTSRDVDILIRPEDRPRCDVLMRELGYERKEDWEPVYTYRRGIEYYEIHTEMLDANVSEKADYQAYFRTIWERLRPENARAFSLSPEDHLIYLLTHIAKHIRSSGAGIRMYLDLAFFLQHFEETLNAEYLSRELDLLGLSDFANVVFALVECFFAVASPVAGKPLEQELFVMLADYTMEGGIFGHTGRDSGTLQLKKQVQETRHLSKIGTLLHRLFPSAQSIETRYTYLQTKPWLLPAAWIHRLFRTRSGWKAHTEEMKHILRADEQEVLKLNEIYHRIGL